MRQALKDLYRAEPNFLINTPSIGLQVEQLIVRPLSKYRGDKAVILLDALDECAVEGSKLRSEFLETLGRTFARLPKNISIFVTSRPLQDLRKQLSDYTPRMMTLEATENLNDIKLYARYRVNRLRPFLAPDTSIDTLADKLSTMAHGLFVWLYLACDTMDKSDDPIQTIAELEERTLGNDEDRMDAIYTRALVTSYKGGSESSIPLYTKQLGALVALRTPMSIEGLSGLLGVTSTSVKVNLSRLESLLVISKSSVQLMHKSVADFITSKDRCTGDASPFYINKQEAECHLARMCLLAVPSKLRLDSVPMQIEQLRGIVPSGSPTHIIYACSHWADHLDSVQELDNELKQALVQALQIYGRGMLIVTVLKNRPSALSHILQVGGGSTLLKATEATNFFNHPILIESCLSNSAGVCEALLKHADADVNCLKYGRDSAGRISPLEICISASFVDTLNVLLRYGADIEEPTSLEALATRFDEELTIERLRRRAEAEISHMDNMMNAARLDNLVQLKQLLDAHPSTDINRQYPTCGDKSLLLVACQYGSVKVTTCILELGADPNLVDNRNLSPLHHACAFGSLDAVKTLVKAGAYVDAEGLDDRDQFFSNKFVRPIDLACQNGHIEVVRWLLDNGVSPSAIEEGKVHPLLYASIGESIDIMSLLLSKGVDVDYNSKYLGTALFAAACVGVANSVEYLLNVGADSTIGWDLDDAVVDGPLRIPSMTPLKGGVAGSFQDVVALLAPGSRPEDRRPEVQINAMALSLPIEYQEKYGEMWLPVKFPPIVMAAMHDNPRLVELFLPYGEDIEATTPFSFTFDLFGATALIYSARQGRIVIARMLLDAGANVNALVESRRSSLHITAVSPVIGDRVKADVVRLLGFFRASLDHVDIDGYTALYLAVTTKAIQTVETLLELGANVNLADNMGNTPLHEAAKRDAVNMVTVLVHGGADKSKQNLEGLTPLQIAQKEGHNNLLHLLK
ncbi:hypothetical protein SmJEL517_g05705 [Synchytrium microbalum]|uniref:Nephrocystin 3-like N-terminal domain-containing protein n=1 Tax=Synchytrium microbalum TaxID=1806994 RepID=A0A507BZY4_9FUNG|nr:uncharacterized protein SmJEL517_g05705 [Synchytrium microbalum]TPX30833.1 hypothetical protein SmJEL517_g05705 [Synchytrium microbalum]